VLAPGEIERQTRAARLADGIPLDARTLADLVDAAASVGIDVPRFEALLAEG
jgi:uncharacterized oxidoreductase